MKERLLKLKSWSLALTLTLLLGSLCWVPAAEAARIILAPPFGLIAQSVSGNQIDLSWSYNSSYSAAAYTVESSMNAASSFIQIGQTDPGVAAFQAQNLKPGTTYYFRVRAFVPRKYRDIYSDYSAIASAHTSASVLDQSAPTVALTAPTAGTVISEVQVLTVSASAADNIGLSKVEFFDGSTLKGIDTTAPYAFIWSVGAADNGVHSLMAKAYDIAGNVSSSAVVSVSVAVAAAVYEAPVLNPVIVSNGEYLLSWSLPATAYGIPSGGYDVFVDGVDDNLHHTSLSAVKTGLPLDMEHCFAVESRWLQAVPAVFPLSNTVCVAAAADITAPTVSLTSPTTGSNFTSAQTVTVAASAADNLAVVKVEFYDGSVLKGTDTSAPYTYAWTVGTADNGGHSLTAKAYDAAGNFSTSVAVGVNVAVPAAEYVAPVLNSVTISGGDYLLSWSLPVTAYGVPSGGYDVFVDGVDDNLHHTSLSAVKTGLALDLEHCFAVEARWLQAVPAVFPASNQICVAGTVDGIAPTVSITSPATGKTYTSAQTVTITAAAADNLGVAKVEFYDGSTLKGTDASAPYTFSWAISEALNGVHSFKAKAYDAAGNSQSSSLVALTVTIAASNVSAEPLKVFPGAEGYAAESVGGRGPNPATQPPQIIRVTNLNDSGAGSLREAVQASGPRFVVFDVSGTIALQSDLSIKNPYITISGQTAPAPGIQLRNQTVVINTHDVVLQHLAIRPGSKFVSGTAGDVHAIQMLSASKNVIVDHCSLFWGIDECVGIYGDDISLTNNIVAEGLQNAGHTESNHGYGILVMYDANNVSLIKNLIAHQNVRLPYIRERSPTYHLNNYAYDGGSAAFFNLTNGSVAPNNWAKLTSIGNVYSRGPSTTTVKGLSVSSTLGAGTEVYQIDNVEDTASPYKGLNVYSGNSSWTVSAPPFAPPVYKTVLPSSQVKGYVLANAGARPAFRDSADQRIIMDAKNFTGSLIDTEANVGGWPAYSQNHQVFYAGDNPTGDDDGDGYLNIEEILHQLAAKAEGK